MAVPSNLPIKLTNERVWRTYLGGALLDAFHGTAAQEDSHFPEEWIMSVVSARNVGREDLVEGLSGLPDHPGISLRDLIAQSPAEYLGAAHTARFGAHPGVLVKLIDSSERLTLQSHPDRAQAKALFGSEYGKTECWHILGVREVDDQPPCVYLGFREGVTRAHWASLFHQQNIPAMLDCLHRFEVAPGDTVLIEGGIPHAIGAGCFLVEIQEPTDYTIRVERTTPSGFAVDDFLCHQGLGFERMFECFRYGGLSREETRRRWFLTPQSASHPCGAVHTLLSYAQTPFFCLNLFHVQPQLSPPLSAAFSGLYVLEGAGTLRCNGDEFPLAKGEQFFLPAGLGAYSLHSFAPCGMKLLRFAGPNSQPAQ